MVVGISAEPPTLDPRLATDATGTRIASLMFNGLVRLGSTFVAEPEAAESWTLKGNTFTFLMRKDLKFHNGRALKLEDLEFSFATALGPSSPYNTVRDAIKNYKAREKNGRIYLDIELFVGSEKFLTGELRGIKIVPKQETIKAGNNFAKQLIGTGGYRFVRQTSNEIELEAVTARTKHLIFKVIHDDFTRYQKMLKGDLDILQMEIGPDRVAAFEKRPDQFQVLKYAGLSMNYLLVNLRDPLLSQLKVRQALAHSLNREEIIKYKFQGLAKPATSILTPDNPYYNTKLQQVDYNLAQAKTIMESLGLKGSELTLKTSNTPQVIDTGRVLAYQMSQSGIKVNQQSYEWATYYGDVKRGNFQLATMKWVPMVDPEIYKMAFHSSETPPGRNRGYYLNPRLDKLTEEGQRTGSVSKRKEIFDEVQELVHSDLAIIPLWYEQQIAIAKKSVVNYHPNHTGDYWTLLEASKVHD